MSTTAKVLEIIKVIENEKAKYQEIHSTLNETDRRQHTEAFKLLQASLQKELTDGCIPCKECNSLPFGIPHQTENKKTKKVFIEYELGCPLYAPSINNITPPGRCSNSGVRGGTVPQHAIDLWNEENAKN